MDTIYDHELTSLEGDRQPLAALRGKVVLIVNVASKCGFTPQYAALEELSQEYKARGLVVLGVPCNEFGNQEPGEHDEIRSFCSSRYDVTFPMHQKVKVKKGVEQHPLYEYLTREAGRVNWNFNKFLVGRDGVVVKRFGPMTRPMGAKLRAAIEMALANEEQVRPNLAARFMGIF